MSESKIKIVEKNIEIREIKKDSLSDLEKEVSENKEDNSQNEISNNNFQTPVLRQENLEEDSTPIIRELTPENGQRQSADTPQFSESARYDPSINQTNVNTTPTYRTQTETLRNSNTVIRPQTQIAGRSFDQNLGVFRDDSNFDNKLKAYDTEFTKTTKGGKPRLPWE